jgi:transcriptional regulator of arginine metabolism
MNKDAAATGLHRRDEILRIVREGRVRSQEELQQALRRRGIRVTQPTLSRDLKDLAIAKSPAGYVTTSLSGDAPAPPPDEATLAARLADALDRVLREFALSVERSGTLVVVKTPPAAANPVARAIDDARLPGTAGTIAGDDTIFLAARSAAHAARLNARLLRAIHPGTARRSAPATARSAS